MKKSRLRYLQKERKRRAAKKTGSGKIHVQSYHNPNNVDFDLVFDWIDPLDNGLDGAPYVTMFGLTIYRVCSDEINVDGEYLGGPEHCETCKAIWSSERFARLLHYVQWSLTK